jgi:hypothetical protein
MAGGALLSRKWSGHLGRFNDLSLGWKDLADIGEFQRFFEHLKVVEFHFAARSIHFIATATASIYQQ